MFIHLFCQKLGCDIYLAIFSQTHLVTLLGVMSGQALLSHLSMEKIAPTFC
jgi:hypothetical protein